MPMPLPPAAAGPTPTPAVAETTAPVATADAATTTTDAKVGFGPGRGEGQIQVPQILNLNFKAMIDGLFGAVTAQGVDLAAVVSEFKATPKNKIPGNKDGRAFYSLGVLLNNLLKTHGSLNKSKLPKEKRPRVKQSEVFAKDLLRLVKAMGGDEAKIREVLGDDAAKYLSGDKK